MEHGGSCCFGPFPFPVGAAEQEKRIGSLADAPDPHRERQKALHPALTLTDTDNVLAKLRSGEPLTEKDRIIPAQGPVSVLEQIHDDPDAAMCDAYGWPSELTDDQAAGSHAPEAPCQVRYDLSRSFNTKSTVLLFINTMTEFCLNTEPMWCRSVAS